MWNTRSLKSWPGTSTKLRNEELGTLNFTRIINYVWKLRNINDKADTLLAVLCRSLHKTTI